MLKWLIASPDCSVNPAGCAANTLPADWNEKRALPNLKMPKIDASKKNDKIFLLLFIFIS